MATDAVVVGGGAIGVACAHYLAEEGLRITLVDRDELGGGCSFANAGLICPGHSQALPGPGIVSEGLRALARRDGPFTIRPRAGPGVVRWLLRFLRSSDVETYRRSTDALVRLSKLSLELYRDLEARGGVELGLRDGPLLETFSSEGWRSRADLEEEELRRLGFEARIVEGDELFDLEPALAPSTLGALVIEDQPSGDCHAYVRAIGAGLAPRGARIFEHTHVDRILVQDGRVTGVLAGDPPERIPADLVVLAAGAWSRSLAGSIGLRLPMQPATGYSSTMPAWEGAPRLPLIGSETRVVILPLGNRIRFAGTLELAGFRREPDPVRYDAVVRSGSAALREPPPGEGEPWFGFRPLLPDGLPAIGWAPGVDGVLIATGHGTLGFTQSPATGRLIAELAAGRPPSVPVEPFRPDRF